MRFKLGILDFRKNLVIYIMLILQLSAVMITVIIALSTVRSKSRLYEPFSNYYKEQGLFSVMGFAVDSEGRPINSTDELKNSMKKTESIAGCYSCWTTADELDFSFISYDDEIVRKYKPSLKKGKWLSNDSYNIVVSENDYNIDVGDVVELMNKNGRKIPFTVSGVLNNSTPVPGILPTDSFEKISYKHFYSNYNIKYEKKPLIIVPKNYKEFDYSIINQMLIRFSDSITKEEINDNISFLTEMGAFINAEISSVEENSDKLIKNELITLFPAIIAVASIAIVSIICSSVLSAKRQIKNYTICYICGSGWRTCCFINLFQTATISVLSLFCTIASILIISFEKLQGVFFIDLQIYDVIIIIIILLIYFVLSFLIPFFILKRTSPVKLLHTN